MSVMTSIQDAEPSHLARHKTLVTSMTLRSTRTSTRASARLSAKTHKPSDVRPQSSTRKPPATKKRLRTPSDTADDEYEEISLDGESEASSKSDELSPTPTPPRTIGRRARPPPDDGLTPRRRAKRKHYARYV